MEPHPIQNFAILRRYSYRYVIRFAEFRLAGEHRDRALVVDPDPAVEGGGVIECAGQAGSLLVAGRFDRWRATRLCRFLLLAKSSVQ